LPKKLLPIQANDFSLTALLLGNLSSYLFELKSATELEQSNEKHSIMSNLAMLSIDPNMSVSPSADFNSSLNTNFITEIGAAAIVSELIALPFLTAAIYVMYRGVEIDHPVYSILFNNLIFPLIVTCTIICSAFVVDKKRVILTSEYGNLTSLLFHHSSWMVLSCLRYAYIIKPDWLHSKFPDAKPLRRLSIVAVFVSFSMIVTIVLTAFFATALHQGWPKTLFFLKLEKSKKVTVISAVSVSYYLPVLVSLIIYLRLSIAISAKMSKVSDSNFQIQKEPSIENANLPVSAVNVSALQPPELSSNNLTTFGVDHIGDESSNEEIIEEIQAEQDRVNINNIQNGESIETTKAFEEKAAALRSLKTNLLVISFGILATCFVYSLPPIVQQPLNLVGTSILKSVLPLATTIANFGTVRSVSKTFFKNIFSH